MITVLVQKPTFLLSSYYTFGGSHKSHLYWRQFAQNEGVKWPSGRGKWSYRYTIACTSARNRSAYRIPDHRKHPFIRGQNEKKKVWSGVKCPVCREFRCIGVINQGDSCCSVGKYPKINFIYLPLPLVFFFFRVSCMSFTWTRDRFEFQQILE